MFDERFKMRLLLWIDGLKVLLTELEVATDLWQKDGMML